MAETGRGWWQRLREGLGRTREQLAASLDALVGRPVDARTLEAVEEALILADVGAATAAHIVDRLRAGRGLRTAADVRAALRQALRELLGPPVPLRTEPPPAVILVLGVNGTGKTTTIGKLAWRLRAEGKRVLLGAADTFRAAAAEQLSRWGARVGAEVVAHRPGGDPGAVVFDTLEAARARGADVALIDTAGRLHTKVNLMEELRKIDRIVRRADPPAVERLLVLDATTGQNALSQARLFHEAVEVTGIALTKVDGTARGGIVLAIARELGLPVKLLGTGEGVEDLVPFDPDAFVDALVPPAEAL
ncbi:MAG: signal recognition particle-docking protein FtsY [Armatimonadota bacterium]|nr:signal recognition particle-docking protein FtsY [Armatimonadota bacterium]MDR7449342.1 signal recognition particle-docking protein FtsY [Armatimonadota bacterium]MDR7458789.1 signal recognition particle-docking protein FtsY [Armatimonadota bacterium]MDR7480007.1 signal recognition particle-docking protein FtsY [Armatimonadota bacterium]MDR7488603.1 signal recognition particle-docking protein FtsY [Armatimonadota bacterium]